MVVSVIKRIGRKILGRRSSSVAAAGKQAESTNVDVSVKTSPQSVAPVLDGAMRFEDFNLPDPIMRAVRELGFTHCTPIQQKVLGHVRAGKNIAGRAQTGTGKTAAFLISIFSRFLASDCKSENRKTGMPRALVIAPTRELVMQIAKDAKDLGKHTSFECVALYGGMDFDKQRRMLTERRIDLVAATPGRLLDFVGRKAISLKHVETLVIDEADRMLDMGFIPDVRRIVRATPPNDKRQTMLFSATLTKEVLRLASQWMPNPEICEVESTQMTVDTVQQIIYIVRAQEKFNLLYNLLTLENMTRVLIFSNRRDSTLRLVKNLERYGISCSHLSGAVPQEKRSKVLEDFRKGKIRVVVATDVAGRGLHVDNISHVINYDFPYEPEDYVHRIGRTGRAGLAGISISFACEEESFVIPEIEEYIGESLKCVMPEPRMLEPPSPVNLSSAQTADEPAVNNQPRPRRQSSRSGGNRGGHRGDHRRSSPR